MELADRIELLIRSNLYFGSMVEPCMEPKDGTRTWQQILKDWPS